MINPLLQEYIDSKIDQATVILSCRILIMNHKENGIDATMSKSQIKSKFDALCTQYGVTTFRSDYVTRQCAHDDSAITQSGDRFFIRPNFLSEMEDDDYAQIINQIDTHWADLQNRQNNLLLELRELLRNGTEEVQCQYIHEMITERETTKKGQAFEVSSFAVLCTYLSSLGFSLNRYSTTYSNDGGIDFFAQNAVYQVTTRLTNSKYSEDLRKVPGKKRIFVYKDLARDFSLEHFNNELVLNHLSANDLCNILENLAQKNSRKYLSLIINTMIEEFNREFYQNDTPGTE